MKSQCPSCGCDTSDHREFYTWERTQLDDLFELKRRINVCRACHYKFRAEEEKRERESEGAG